ncbi:MAG: hypothetical protein K6G81_10850 [Lachnospiraceae bacterium]|nr:hypothetical protein [Lachnospiraceae bacterium]
MSDTADTQVNTAPAEMPDVPANVASRTQLLTGAVAKIESDRAERIARKETAHELDDRYRAMFRKMGAFRGRYVNGLGFCLEPAEKALLAQYLFTEAEDSEKNTLSSALMEDLEAGGARDLYRQCLLHYDEQSYKALFGMLKGHLGFAKEIEKAYGYKPDEAMNALASGRGAEFFNGKASILTSSNQEDEYFTALRRIGVPEGSKLYRECAQLFVLVCDAGEYKRVGAEELLNVASDWNKDLKRRLLANMLAKLDAFQLRQFIPMLDMFMSLVGAEGTASYEEVMSGVSPVNRKKFKTWMNQHAILDTFGDGDRSRFWMDYIDRCSVSRHRPSGALILDFTTFKVIEFAHDIPSYFYDAEYFEQKVSDGLAVCSSEEELNRWLELKTDWVQQDGVNSMHWRKAHQGNWKTDIRDYISKYAPARR